MTTRSKICRLLYILHEIKAGPSTLTLKRSRALQGRVFALETRALAYLAGDPGEPAELLKALEAALQEVRATIPKTHPGRGNPGRKKMLTADVWVIKQHKATGRSITELVREAQRNKPPEQLDPHVEVSTHAKRIRDLQRSGIDF